MLVQGQIGALPAQKQTGGNPNVLQGFSGELLKSDVNPFYYTLLKNNRIFFQQATAVTNTGFVGGAGGVPLIGLYNPVGSAVDAVILATAIAARSQGTAAGAPGSINWYGGVSVLPTGTNTPPINAYSQQAVGSGVKTFVNTAMTSSTAVTLTRAVVGFGANPGTTAPSTVAVVNDYPFGTLVAAPGVLQALGAAVTATASSFDVTVFWAELPV